MPAIGPASGADKDKLESFLNSALLSSPVNTKPTPVPTPPGLGPNSQQIVLQN